MNHHAIGVHVFYKAGQAHPAVKADKVDNVLQMAEKAVKADKDAETNPQECESYG
jgi:hypothetical protein